MGRKYSPEYKIEAANLVLEQGYSIAQACLELGIGDTVLRHWINQVKTEQEGYVLAGSKPLSPEQQCMRELEKQVKILKEDKEILKKSAAIFMFLDKNAIKR